MQLRKRSQRIKCPYNSFLKRFFHFSGILPRSLSAWGLGFGGGGSKEGVQVGGKERMIYLLLFLFLRLILSIFVSVVGTILLETNLQAFHIR